MKRSLNLQSLTHRLNPSRIASHQPHLHPLLRQPRTLREPSTTKQPSSPYRLTPHRTFFNLPDLSSILPSSNSSTRQNQNNNDPQNPNRRTLTANRTFPYPPPPLFNVIASVESYSSFLPFLAASTVTARDPETKYPTQAFLTVGYGPLSETFTSKVDCDRENLVVEARSGSRFGVDKKLGQRQGAGGVGFPGASEGIFEYLSTRWVLVPLEGEKTRVELRIQFEFRSSFHAAVMSAVEGQMAGIMVEAFEKRMREVQQ